MAVRTGPSAWGPWGSDVSTANIRNRGMVFVASLFLLLNLATFLARPSIGPFASALVMAYLIVRQLMPSKPVSKPLSVPARFPLVLGVVIAANALLLLKGQPVEFMVFVDFVIALSFSAGLYFARYGERMSNQN